MDVSRVSLRRYSIVICMKMTCRARNVMHFAAQAQRFVRSSVCYAVPLGLAFGDHVFGVEIIPNVWCGANFVEADRHEMILPLFVAGAVLCVGFEAWKCDSRGRRREW